MSLSAVPCRACGRPLPADGNPRRQTCGSACRSALSRRRRAEALRTSAAGLAERRDAALRTGDAAALAAVTREALDLLGVTIE